MKLFGEQTNRKWKGSYLVLDFFREIRRNFGRFFSIFLVVMLGTFTFVGLRSTAFYMRSRANGYFMDQKMMDFLVFGTYGVTDQDVSDMKELSGVGETEGGRSVDAIFQTEDREFVIHVVGETEKINLPYVTEGRLPKSPDECLLDAYGDVSDLFSIGDRIILTSGTNEPLTNQLKSESFVIVGKGYLPQYVDTARGASSVGSGKVDSIAVVPQDAFQFDYYTEAYVVMDDYNDEWVDSFSKERQQKSDTLKEELEQFGDIATKRRYDELFTRYSDAISQGSKELEEGKKKLEDGKQEIEDGKQKLSEAADEITQKSDELDQGEKDYIAGKQKIEDGADTIEKTKKQILEQQNTLEQKKAELANSESEFWAGVEQYAAGVNQYKEGRTKLDDGKAQLAAAEAQYQYGKGKYDGLNEFYHTVEQYMEEYSSLLPPEALTVLQAKMEEAKQKLAAANASLQSARAELDQKQKEAAGAEMYLAMTDQELFEAKTKLDQSWGQIMGGQQAVTETQKTLMEQHQKLYEAELDLASGNKKIQEAGAELESGKSQLDSAKSDYKESAQELYYGQQRYEAGLPGAQKKLDEGEKQLEEAEKKLEELVIPEWYVMDRNTLECFAGYKMNMQRVNAMGNVFPILFFLVASLVSLTAMTRMVAEQRKQTGTLLAMGFEPKAMRIRFLSYVLLATVVGGTVGAFVGAAVLPRTISHAYQTLYPGLLISVESLVPSEIFMSIIFAALSTGIATFAASEKQLKEIPSDLMRPEPPKSGTRIIFERITFLWKRLSFSSKSTVRNLFRYKKRLFMTIIGISGCMMLLCVGVGMRDSIQTSVNKQFKDIETYDCYVKITSNVSKLDIDKLIIKVENLPEAEETLTGLYMTQYADQGNQYFTINCFAVDDSEHLTDFFTLRDRQTGESVSLPDDGVLLTEKAATLLNVNVGDQIELLCTEGENIKIPIRGIVENYVLHYVFLTRDTYEKYFGKKMETNRIYINLAENCSTEDVVKALQGNPAVAEVTPKSHDRQRIVNMVSALNRITSILIGTAALLAFIVLYNLNSINITERIRELATLQVLGFSDREVAAYVQRENIFMTITGIILGGFLGFFAEKMVVGTIEIDYAYFIRSMHWYSYLICAGLTFLFAIIVDFIMGFVIRKIDMIEALKSVE